MLVMRYFYLLFLTVISVSSAIAQEARDNQKQALKHNQIIGALLRSTPYSAPLAAAKSTAGVPTQRVIAQSTVDNGTSLYTDSVTCSYSGMNHSTFDYNTIIYPYNYTYGTSPMFELKGIFTEPQVKYDTYVHWTINPFTMPTFSLYEGNYATYDTNSNQTHFVKLFVDSSTNDNMSYANSFDTVGNIIKGLTFNLNAGIEDSAFKQFFTYDTAHRLVKDSVYELHLGVWRIAARTYYSYNASGYLTQIDHFSNQTDTSFLLPLVQQSKYANTYDASGRLIAVVTSLFDGSSLVNYVKDTFDYTGTSGYHSSWRQHQFDPIHGTWWPQYKMSKHINVAGKPDTVYHQGWDSIANSWTPISKDVITYNTYDNPAKVYNYEYNWTSYSTTPDYTTTYYYEIFLLDEPTRTNIPNNQERLTLYPNPVKDNLHFASETTNGTGSEISVIDMTGRIILRQSIEKGKIANVDVQALAPGNYILNLHDKNGKVLNKAQFIKE